MRRALSLMTLVTAISLFAASAGYTAESAAAAGFKVGTVDFERALNSVDEGKRAKEKLKKELDAKQKEINGLQEELKKMKEELDKQRLILSAEALREKEESFRTKFLQLQELSNKHKMELQTQEIQATSGILNRLKEMVTQIGKQDGYTLILEKSQDIVLYSPPDADLTDRIISMFNKKK